MMKDLVIVGSGGFGKEVRWLIERMNKKKPEWNILGFIDSINLNEEIIGNDDYLLNCKNELYVVIAIGNAEKRKELVAKYRKNSRLKFPSIVDPSTILGKVQMGDGNIICAGSILTVDIQLGCFGIINLGCTIGHDVSIADYVTINPGVNVSGNVKIGSVANIGTGVQIIQGLSIGKETTVGAGAVVNKDLPERCVAVGVPAKVIKYRMAAQNEKNQ